MMYHNIKEYNAVIKELVAKGWKFIRGKKHSKVKAPCGRSVTISISPSDNRSYLNLLRDIRRIENQSNEPRKSP